MIHEHELTHCPSLIQFRNFSLLKLPTTECPANVVWIFLPLVFAYKTLEYLKPELDSGDSMANSTMYK